MEWDHVDFVYAGKKIEVKSGGYVQTWSQNGPSVIAFDIASKERPWIAETNTCGPPGRSADCYVLCIHSDLDRATCAVKDALRWEFYVFRTEELALAFGEQKTVRLSRIHKLEKKAVRYSDLRREIDTVLGLGEARAPQLSRKVIFNRPLNMAVLIRLTPPIDGLTRKAKPEP
jgi:hypothetical protein